MSDARRSVAAQEESVASGAAHAVAEPPDTRPVLHGASLPDVALDERGGAR